MSDDVIARDGSRQGYRICPICEAGCGLQLDLEDGRVTSIQANANDRFSGGHICAKGLSLRQLDQDPDRLKQPMLRSGDNFREVSWEEALEAVNAGLRRVIEAHGPASVATYIGNPSAHNIGLSLGLGVFLGQLGSPHIYSAGSVDQLPKQLACELMFGNGSAVPVPDIERTDYLLMLGANPIVSNGSLWMVPDFRGKLRDLHGRGGRLVTVDPRRTETARLADAHHFIRPGTDAWLLGALIQQLRMAGVQLPEGCATENEQALFDALAGITLETAAAQTGISTENIRGLASELQSAANPVVYGRVGTTLQRHGTLTSFLIEVLNLMLGSLDAAGGAVFPEQAFNRPAHAWRGEFYDRYRTRVSGYPEVLGQYPAAALAEEMETPGEGQVHALVCFAGNPVVSNPDSDRLARAIDSLDFVVCVDIYHTETSRLADVILPGTSPFEDVHYDEFLGAMGYRNVARYSPAVFDTERPKEWDIGLTLGFMVKEQRVPSQAALQSFEDNVVAGFVAQHCADESGSMAGRDVQDIMARLESESGVERMLEVGVRAGRWGDAFGAREGLTLKQLAGEADGVDFGLPRTGRLAEVNRRPGKTLNLGPAPIVADLKRLTAEEGSDGLLLIGRRNVGTNNSWLRNLEMLGKGKSPCVLEMHEDDATEFGIEQGDTVQVSTATGSLAVPVILTRDMARGVVALPHGFSAADDLMQQRLLPGENYNRLAAAGAVDVPSATAALNGIPVTVTPFSH